jgi:hypothetical protein
MVDRKIVLAKVRTVESVGLLHCYGVQAGDVIVQAMAWSNGDDVSGVFAPIIPARELIAQIRPVGDLECLLVLHRVISDE